MPYDKALDKQLFSETAEFDTTKITVAVYAYNDGIPKIQISRENVDQNTGDMKWSKLGRMTKEEAQAVLPLVNKAIEKM